MKLITFRSLAISLLAPLAAAVQRCGHEKVWQTPGPSDRRVCSSEAVVSVPRDMK